MSIGISIKLETDIKKIFDKRMPTPVQIATANFKTAVYGMNLVKRATVEEGHKLSGATANAWQVVKGSGVDSIIENKLPTATWLEKGTRPHTIVPRNKKILVFPSKSFSKEYVRLTGAKREGAKNLSKEKFKALVKSGDLIIARKVNHPGTKPYKILERQIPAIQKKQTEFIKLEVGFKK